MSKNIKGITILKIKLLPSGEVGFTVREESVELLPSCAKVLLSGVIGIAIQKGVDPLDIMRECKDILEEAWNENGVDWLIEQIDDSNDKKDRMGLQ